MKNENESKIVLERIEALANEQGIAKSFLCRKMGVSNSYFNDIKKDFRKIPSERLSLIARLLHTTPEYLQGKTDNKVSFCDSRLTQEEMVTELYYDNIKLRELVRGLSEDNWRLRAQVARLQGFSGEA